MIKLQKLDDALEAPVSDDCKQERNCLAVSGTLQLCRMTAADCEAAAALEASCSAEAWSAKAFADAAADPNALYIAAWLDNQMVGCCGLWQSFEEADICNVAVDESCRRRGIAQKMLEQLMLSGRERGILHFTLEVRSKNAPAIRLYEKLGFTAEGVRRRFYENPADDALIMWKRQETHG